MTTEAELLKHSGGFEYPQLKTRSVILAATDQVSSLKQTVAVLMEKFGSGVIAEGTRDYLELLRSKYPQQCAASSCKGVRPEKQGFAVTCPPSIGCQSNLLKTRTLQATIRTSG
jgi:hypothetical protein